MTNFNQLISSIEDIHRQLQASAANAVNQTLTIRNWLIGYYIVEFEQNGEDKALYGTKLLSSLAEKINHIKGIDERALRRFRQFYRTYPQIRIALSQKLLEKIPMEIRGSLSPISENLPIRGSLSPETEAASVDSGLQVSPEILISRLSYSHIELLLNIESPLKRTFYEIECINGTWKVRDLKRQIASQYFERSGLSEKPEKLAELVRQKTNPQAPKDIIKNIYTFEFLDLKTRELVEESDLETALLDHLQQFIIELGNGFCCEARQKRILIGETYYFIDLVFYHRILKCHVLLELKIGEFQHGNIGQLNTYLNYFKKEVSEQNDNPPVGILMVAEKDHALVEYATAGMDKNLFVQQYMLQLPSTEQLKAYMEKELKELR